MQHINELNVIGEFDASVVENRIKELLPKLVVIHERFQESDMTEKEIHDIVHELEEGLRPFDKILGDVIIQKLILSDKEDEASLKESFIEISKKILQRYGTEPKQVITALEEVIDKLRVYTEPDGPVDESHSTLKHIKSFGGFE